MKIQIQKIDNNNKIIATYNNLMIAAKSIKTNIEPWKVALSIYEAIYYNKKAYKAKWKLIK